VMRCGEQSNGRVFGPLLVGSVGYKSCMVRARMGVSRPRGEARSGPSVAAYAALLRRRVRCSPRSCSPPGQQLHRAGALPSCQCAGGPGIARPSSPTIPPPISTGADQLSGSTAVLPTASVVCSLVCRPDSSFHVSARRCVHASHTPTSSSFACSWSRSGVGAVSRLHSARSAWSAAASPRPTSDATPSGAATEPSARDDGLWVRGGGRGCRSEQTDIYTLECGLRRKKEGGRGRTACARPLIVWV
jgi:hypothetical protein